MALVGCFKNLASACVDVGRSSKASSSWPSPKFLPRRGMVSLPQASGVFSVGRYRRGLGDRIVDRDTAREFGRNSMVGSESCRRKVRELLALMLYDWAFEDPAGRNGTGALRARAAALSVVLIRSTGVLGRNVGGGRVDCSVRDGGRSYRAGAGGRAGDCVPRMTGSDRFRRRSCALVVVGSVRSDTCDALWPSSILRGVEGVTVWVDEGVVGVVTLLRLVTDECAE